MKICLFYPHNLFASWYALGGYVKSLKRLGHEIVDCPFPGNRVDDATATQLKSVFPTIDKINAGCDCVLSAYHEYSQPWLEAVYGEDDWKRLTIPVVARYDESMDRSDLGLPARMPVLKAWAQFHSFPAAQDAKEFGGYWEPYGADTEMFSPLGLGDVEVNQYGEAKKLYDVAFIGSLYPLRQKYLKALQEAGGEDHFPFHVGQCFVQDLSGICERESVELLAKNLREIKIFFCLPPMSRLIVCKVCEIMACGTMVMYPRLPGKIASNMSQFEDGKEIVYYDVGYMKDNIAMIKKYLDLPKERVKIARAGLAKIRERHTIDQMLERILLPVSENVTPKSNVLVMP
jgi:hypothetical protein